MSEYPLASSTWDQEEIEAINSVVLSGNYSMGEKVEQFERRFSDLFEARYSVMVNSGSSANLLMIASLFYTSKPYLKRGDEIIVPAVSWSTTYYPLQQFGLKVKFVDIDQLTLNIDIQQLEDSITDKTKAILLVNLLGNPNDFSKILKIVQNKNIFILEDNCEAMGAKYNDRFTGSFGLMGTFSTFFSHHISTMEGGVVITDDEELYHVMLCLRAHGWTRNLPKYNLVTNQKSDDSFEESFKFVLPGYNLRPLEFSGAIGIEQLKKLPAFIETRRQNAARFVEYFNDHEYLSIQIETGKSSWFGFSLIIKKGAPFNRQKLINNLKKYGIEIRPIVTGNFLKNKGVLKYFEYQVSGTLDIATWLDENGLFVGNHHFPLDKGLSLLKTATDEVLKT